MSSGMFFESVRTLITNELQVPTLHGLEAKDGAWVARRVDRHLAWVAVTSPGDQGSLQAGR